MIYGFEQYATLANANQNLMLKFAEISREAVARQAEIAKNSFAAFGVQAAEQKPGTAVFPGFAGLTDVLKEAEQNRQTSIAAVQNAVGEWSACVNSAFRIGDAQQPFGDVFQAWTQQFLTAVGVAAPTDAGSGKHASGGAA